MALPRLETLKYPVIVPSTGQKIHFRPYNVKEEKLLLIAKESENDEQMILAAKDLIEACTFKEVDVSKLTTFDFEFLFLKIRSKSVGETANISAACSSCGDYNPVEVNLDNIRVDNLMSVKDRKSKMKIAITPSVGLILSYPKFKTIEAISNMDKNSGEFITKMVSSCIESVYDDKAIYSSDDYTDDEIEEFIDSLPSKKFKEISEIIENIPIVVADIEFKCTKCGKENKQQVQGLSNFF